MFNKFPPAFEMYVGECWASMHNAMQTTVAMDWHWDSLTHQWWVTTAYFYIVRDRKYQFIERHLVLVENHVISFERFSFRIFWLCSIIQWGVMVDTAERETEHHILMIRSFWGCGPASGSGSDLSPIFGSGSGVGGIGRRPWNPPTRREERV